MAGRKESHLVFLGTRVIGKQVKQKDGRESRQNRARRTELELPERRPSQLESLFKSALISKEKDKQREEEEEEKEDMSVPKVFHYSSKSAFPC